MTKDEIYSKLCFLSLNSNILVSTYNEQLTSKNALDTIKMYDIVVDATDNVATRYLLNDACVLLNKPLVSGSALQVMFEIASITLGGQILLKF